MCNRVRGELTIRSWESKVNLLHSSIHILGTIVFSYPMMLTRRVCFTARASWIGYHFQRSPILRVNFARSFRPWPSVVHGIVVSHFHLPNRSWLNEPKEIQRKLLKNNILYSTAQRINFLPGKHFYRRKEK